MNMRHRLRHARALGALALVCSKTACAALADSPADKVELQPLVGELDRAVCVPVFPDACGSYYFGDLQSLLQNASNNIIKGYVMLEDAVKQADSRLNTCLLSGK